MATFIVTGNLPQKALAGYLAKPEDRTAPLGTLFEQAGGKLRAFYFTTGAHDFLMIIENGHTNRQTLYANKVTEGLAERSAARKCFFNDFISSGWKLLGFNLQSF